MPNPEPEAPYASVCESARHHAPAQRAGGSGGGGGGSSDDDDDEFYTPPHSHRCDCGHCYVCMVLGSPDGPGSHILHAATTAGVTCAEADTVSCEIDSAAAASSDAPLAATYASMCAFVHI